MTVCSLPGKEKKNILLITLSQKSYKQRSGKDPGMSRFVFIYKLNPTLLHVSEWLIPRNSPSCFLGAGSAGPRLNFLKGSRLTLGGRLGFKGRGPSGGRCFLSGVTSPVLLCRGCWRSGGGVEEWAGEWAWAGAGAGARAGLMPGCLWFHIILFCSISPVCFTLVVSAGWMDGLTPGFGGGRGKAACLEGMGAAIGSALENLIMPGPAIADGSTVGDSLWWARSLSVTGRIALPNPGRGDFGEPLSRLLVSEVLALLLNLALRALTSMLSPWQQHRSTNSTAAALVLKQEVSSTARHGPHASTHTHTGCQNLYAIFMQWECTVQQHSFLVMLNSPPTLQQVTAWTLRLWRQQSNFSEIVITK